MLTCLRVDVGDRVTTVGEMRGRRVGLGGVWWGRGGGGESPERLQTDRCPWKDRCEGIVVADKRTC